MIMEDLQLVPVMTKDVEAQFVEIMVPLYSYGCGKKIKKALAHFKGIYSVNVDYNQQKVTVWGICNKKEVLSSIRGKRKGAHFWNTPEDDNDVNDNIQTISHTAPSTPSPSLCGSMIKGKGKGKGKGRPYNWRAAWKKVFNRSNSF
ncbi:hypothetical protein OSB04_026073 [Centaurea solstitialis]|uniref:HMA domain-containing protein n=1 Tax=Centaurea solstitialis TaxID=347529 RepID=A0AA38VYE7_9ASTR|nr:hypothetical protein OSB04_026073 [Centaurea solstitialis]